MRKKKASKQRQRPKRLSETTKGQDKEFVVKWWCPLCGDYTVHYGPGCLTGLVDRKVMRCSNCFTGVELGSRLRHANNHLYDKFAQVCTESLDEGAKLVLPSGGQYQKSFFVQGVSHAQR